MVNSSNYITTSKQAMEQMLKLGIALENKTGGYSCEVCTNGITMALIGNNNTYGITSTSGIKCGMYAFANQDGSVFSPNDISSVSPTNLNNNKYFFI